MSADDLPIEITEEMSRGELLKRLGAGVAVASFAAPAFSSAAFAKTTRSSAQLGPGAPSSSSASRSGSSASAGSASSFKLRVPKGPVNVSEPFSVRVVAIDGNGDNVADFAGPISLYDDTGTLSYDPDAIHWLNGAATVTVQVDEPIRRDSVTVASPRVGSISAGSFAVLGTLSTVSVRTPRAVNAGEPFTVRVRAVDDAGNTITGYAGPLTLTDDTGTLAVQSSSWSEGIGLYTVTIAEGHIRDQIQVTSADPALTAHTRGIIVRGALSAFSIALPRSVAAYSSFLVKLTAIDDAGNRLVDYSGPVTLTDETGRLSYDPGSIVWVNSHASVTVQVNGASNSDRITVREPGGVTATSVTFRVVGSSSSSSSSRFV